MEGVDFLTDHYAVLGVEKDASPEIIQEAFKLRMRENHPDRVATMGSEFKKLAERNAPVITKAKEILLDPVRREGFDTALSKWHGPVSTNGHSFTGGSGVPRSKTVHALGSPALIRRTIESAREEARKTSNVNDDVLETLREVGSQPSASLRSVAALRKALDQQDEALAAEEFIAGNLIGLSDEAFQHTADRRALVEKSINETREGMGKVLSLLAIDTVRKEQLLLSGEVQEAAVAEQAHALARAHEEKLSEGFEMVADHLREIAAKRDAIHEERLKLLRLEYQSAEKNLPRLVVICHSPNGELAVAMELTPDNSVKMVQVPKPPYDGWSVARLQLDHGLRSTEELNEVATLHFSPLLPEDPAP
jgi:curved DNA-binding protein CbpA